MKPTPTSVLIRSQVVANKDGSYTVKAKRPVEAITPKEFAEHLGVSRSTVSRWIDEGTIPEDLVEYVGFRIRIHASAVDHILTESKRRRGF